MSENTLTLGTLENYIRDSKTLAKVSESRFGFIALGGGFLMNPTVHPDSGISMVTFYHSANGAEEDGEFIGGFLLDSNKREVMFDSRPDVPDPNKADDHIYTRISLDTNIKDLPNEGVNFGLRGLLLDILQQWKEA